MDNIIAPKFDKAKEQLIKLSRNVPSDVILERVDTKGTIIPWNSHNVTGEEVNRLIGNIQSSLIQVNKNITPLYQEFAKVYNTFDELDKEYIQGILGAVKSANIASKQAKDASDKALNALGEARSAQNDIKKTVEALQKTVTALKQFKESTTIKLNSLIEFDSMKETLERKIRKLDSDLLKLNKYFDELTKNIRETSAHFRSDIASLQHYQSQLEAYEHLGDVDAIWSDVEQHKKNLTELHEQLDGIAKEISESAKMFKSEIAVLQDYKSQLETYEHLGDVDAIWSDVEQHKKNLTELHEQLDGIAKEISESAKMFKSDIAVLQDYKSQLEAYEHLGDVDAIWSDVEQHKKNLTELHEQLDGIAKEISESAKMFKSEMAVLQDYKSQLESYEHLGDVDAIWGDVEQHKKNLTELHEQLDGIAKEISESAKMFKSDITVLQDYKSQLETYEHLGDVDSIWDNVEQHKNNLKEFHQQLEHFATEYRNDRKGINSSIETIKEENELNKYAINKKIIVAYIMTGFSVAIAIVQFLLNLLHII